MVTNDLPSNRPIRTLILIYQQLLKPYFLTILLRLSIGETIVITLCVVITCIVCMDELLYIEYKVTGRYIHSRTVEQRAQLRVDLKPIMDGDRGRPSYLYH